MASKRTYSIVALTKTVRILDYIKKHNQATLLEIYEALSLPKSSTYQIIQALIGYGILRQDRNKCYQLGLKLFEYGQASIAGLDLRQIARPYIEELSEKTGLTVHLGILNEQYDGIFLDRVDGHTFTFTHTKVGARIIMRCSATGKALIAWQSEEIRKKIISHIQFTNSAQSQAIRTAKKLFKDCDAAVERGYTLDDEESRPNIRGIGVPLFRYDGKVSGAIAIGGLVQSLNFKNCGNAITLLKKTGKAISVQLGAKESSYASI